MKRTADTGADKASPRLPTEGEINKFRSTLIDWHKVFGRDFPWRKSGTSAYVKVVSEILLQRTRAETVASFFPGFIRAYPSWKALASATVSEVGSSIEPVRALSFSGRFVNIITLGDKKGVVISPVKC